MANLQSIFFSCSDYLGFDSSFSYKLQYKLNQAQKDRKALPDPYRPLQRSNPLSTGAQFPPFSNNECYLNFGCVINGSYTTLPIILKATLTVSVAGNIWQFSTHATPIWRRKENHYTYRYWPCNIAAHCWLSFLLNFTCHLVILYFSCPGYHKKFLFCRHVDELLNHKSGIRIYILISIEERGRENLKRPPLEKGALLKKLCRLLRHLLKDFITPGAHYIAPCQIPCKNIPGAMQVNCVTLALFHFMKILSHCHTQVPQNPAQKCLINAWLASSMILFSIGAHFNQISGLGRFAGMQKNCELLGSRGVLEVALSVLCASAVLRRKYVCVCCIDQCNRLGRTGKMSKEQRWIMFSGWTGRVDKGYNQGREKDRNDLRLIYEWSRWLSHYASLGPTNCRRGLDSQVFPSCHLTCFDIKLGMVVVHGRGLCLTIGNEKKEYWKEIGQQEL
ncbi:hypothetical protein VP01_1333g1 [Puccinia sorghi]|uniref:Uncharacterized protein n=1 Tax=Puccinia sorghi TaxID=27349 RepID=A0A0L6VP55_9BASI|nr:hypothetical protein VP01_1333g1 [Puccinia sorghi]